MFDPTACDPGLLTLVDRVVAELSIRSPGLRTPDVMIVGAGCRDILHSAMGHAFTLRATRDIDLGLAMASWTAYDQLTSKLVAVDSTGIRYDVADLRVDLIPFGDVEVPPGTVTPTARKEAINVWGFSEAFRASRPLPLPDAGSIRIPTVAGYTALKLEAWLDRSAYGDYKDASDLAVAVYWYLNSHDVDTYLYETPRGQVILEQEELDAAAAAAYVLGSDVAELLGPNLRADLAQRWPGPRHHLIYPQMSIPTAPNWPGATDRRRVLINAMERGLGILPH